MEQDNPNWITIPVTQDFIDQRDARAEKYNPRGRTLDKLKGTTQIDGKSMVYVLYTVM